MKFKVESLKIGDFDKFYQFAHDFILEQFLDYSPKLREKYFEIEFEPKEVKKMLKRGEKVVFLAWSEGKMVGFTTVDINFKKGGCAWIQWLGVDNQFRRFGIGGELLRAVEKVALKQKCHFIIVYTENTKNVEFYKKRGYDFIGLQKESWFGHDEYLMQKNISKPFYKDLGIA